MDVSVLKQPVLPLLVVSVLPFTAVCAVPDSVCLSVLPKVSGLEQLVLDLDVSVQHQHVLFHELCSV
jgi:hypothetical protein